MGEQEFIKLMGDAVICHARDLTIREVAEDFRDCAREYFKGLILTKGLQ